MTETIETPLPHPANLSAGQIIVRVLSKGERCYERWQVTGWIRPPRPRPGECQMSGFLRCVSLDDGERREFGPASMVREQFRLESPAPESPPATKERRHWWQED